MLKTLGDRLKSAREKKRYTQIEVAQKLGISNGAISGYERNYRDPDTDTLKKLSELYDVDPNWLLGKDMKINKESTYVLPESEIEKFIKEREEIYGVIVRDDPVFRAALRALIDSIAQTMIDEQKKHNPE